MICAGGSGCLIAAQSLRGALTGLAGLASGIVGRYLKWLESRAVMLRWMLVRVQPDPPGAPRQVTPAFNVQTDIGAQLVGGCTHERAIWLVRHVLSFWFRPLVLEDVHSQVR